MIYKNAEKNLIQVALLMKALFDTYNEQEGFKTFAKTPACLQHTDAYDMIPKAHLFRHYSHPFSLIFEVLVELYKRRQKGSSVDYRNIYKEAHGRILHSRSFPTLTSILILWHYLASKDMHVLDLHPIASLLASLPSCVLPIHPPPS